MSGADQKYVRGSAGVAFDQVGIVVGAFRLVAFHMAENLAHRVRHAEECARHLRGERALAVAQQAQQVLADVGQLLQLVETKEATCESHVLYWRYYFLFDWLN